MKIALCLHGLADGKNSKGKSVRSDIGFKCMQKELIEPYQMDVFMHSWSTGMKDQLIEWYQPKKYMFEEQINFITDTNKKDCMEQIRTAYCDKIAKTYPNAALSKDGNEQKCYQCWKMNPIANFEQEPNHRSCSNCYWHNKLYYRNLCSLYYSYFQSNRMKSLHEKENNFKYDLVLAGRFDNFIGKVCDLTKLNSENFYFLGFDSKTKKHILDHLFISSSENLDDFCEIYPNLEFYTKDFVTRGSYNQYLNHDAIKIHFERLNMTNLMKNINGKIEAGAMTTCKLDWLKQKCPHAFTKEELEISDE